MLGKGIVYLMALEFDIRAIGDKALEKKLGRLERRIQRKIIISSMRKQAKRTGGHIVRMVETRVTPRTGMFVSAVKALALKPPVTLKRSRRRIGLGIPTPPREMLAPPRSTEPGLWYVPGILEYGDKGSRKSRFGGRGPLKPRRIYRDAVDKNLDISFAIMAREMGDDLIKVAGGR